MAEAVLSRPARRLIRAPRRPRSGAPFARRFFVAPSVLAVLVLGLYPLVFIAAASVTESSLGRPFQAFVGAQTFAEVLTDGDLVASFVRSVLYAVAVAAASTVLGVAAAVALHGAVRRGSLVMTLLLLPLMTPPVVVGTLWKLVYNPGGGLLAVILGAVGLPRDAIAPLSSPAWALTGIGVADVWQWAPLVALLVFTALLSQDPETIEAARLDGAHGWRLFRDITLPAVSGVIAAAFFIRLVLAFKVFDLVFMMTSGGPGQSTTVASYAIYQSALREFDVGRAAAITLVLAVVVTAVTIPAVLVTRKLQSRHE